MKADDGSAGAWRNVVFALFGAWLFSYAPLALCIAERQAFNTHHVEDALQRIHLHKPLDRYYGASVHLLGF